MLVSKINTSQTKVTPAFGVKLGPTEDLKKYVSCIYREKYLQPANWHSAKHIALFEQIKNALSKHPADVQLDVAVTHVPYEHFNARGVISSYNGILIDSEPAANNSLTAPIENIFRRILNPKNKEAFNYLVGKNYADVYDNWWNKYISRIWEKLNKEFYESTGFDRSWDNAFDHEFMKQISETKPQNPLINFLKKMLS